MAVLHNTKRAKDNAKLVPSGALEPTAAMTALKKFKGPQFTPSV